MGELGNETIDKLGLVRARTIIRAKENDNVLEVLQMIVANNISAVPVISSQKRIIGNISITDLKVKIMDFEKMFKFFEACWTKFATVENIC